MKIECEYHSAIPGVSDWVERLSSLETDSFLKELSNLTDWPFQRLDDLSSLSPVLDRIDSLLHSYIESSDHSSLSLLLDKSAIILNSASSKSLYNSISELLTILDDSNWLLVYKSLKLIHILVNRVNPIIKETKAHSNSELTNKLYVIGMGSNLNCSKPIPLQLICLEPQEFLLDFVYMNGDEIVNSFESVPQDIDYVRKNRERTNRALMRKDRSELELVVSSQLLALSCLMQIPPEWKLLQNFCRSLPEIWLLPAVNELLSMGVSVEVHTQSINLLSGILVVSEGQTSRQEISSNHLIGSTTFLLAAQQQHGLMQTLLRDLTSTPSILPLSTCKDNQFIESLLHLANLIADYKYKVDSSHVPGMTCSLLQLIQSNSLSMSNKAKAIRVLSVVVSHSIDMFKVISGLEIVVSVLMQNLQLYNQVQHISQAYVIKVLLRLLKIISTKWDSSHTLGHTEVSFVLFDSGLLNELKKSFELKLYDLYEQSLQLLSSFVGSYRQIIVDLMNSGIISQLLLSLEDKLPNNAKMVAVLGKFLSGLTINEDMVQVLGRFSTVQRMIEALASGQSTGLTNDLADNIGESLQTLMTNVPALVDCAGHGLVNLIQSLEAIDVKTVLSKESFFQQLTHIGKVISCLFGFSQTILDIFISSDGFQSYLNVFRLRVYPQTYNNEFHSFAGCCKAITAPSCNEALRQVLCKLNKQLDELEGFVGPLDSISDFSHISDPTSIVHILAAGDSYIEIVRFLLANGGTSEDNISTLCQVLNRLSSYMRILISEQARLSPFSKANNHTTKTFNQPINIQDIENVHMKTFEENFYFTCQLTVRKLYRYTTMRMTNPRGRHSIAEKSGVSMSHTMGNILAQLIKLIDLNEADQAKAYYFCLQLSDILKILLQDQHPNPSTIITFYKAGGSNHVFKFLKQLRRISEELSDDREKSYDLVNSLQILWNLCGKFLEVLAMGKYSSSTSSSAVLKELGYESPRQVNKIMQDLAHDYLQGLGNLECGIYSTAFAKSALDILKSFSDLDKVELDPEVIQTVVMMGFSEQSVINAIKCSNTLDIAKIMEVLTSGKESVEEPARVENLHLIVINSLPAIPILKAQAADILYKICVKWPTKVVEIVNMLALELGILMKDLISDESLFNVMKEKSQVNLLKVAPRFDQLAALITIISILVHKSNEVQETLVELDFIEYTIRIIESFGPQAELEALKCLSPLFSLVEGLSQKVKGKNLKLTKCICELIKVHKNLPSVDHSELSSLIHLLISLTTDSDNCRVLIESKALNDLLALKSATKDDKQLKSTVASFSTLLKQLVEDPFILQGSYEVSLIQGFKEGIELSEYLKLFSTQLSRNKSIFLSAFTNTCTLEGKKLTVSLNKERKDPTGEKWKAVQVICQVLCDNFDSEQKGAEFIMPSQALVSVLADIFQSYPILIKDVINLSVKGHKKFLNYLIKHIVPFRFKLHLEDGKVVFHFPTTTTPVPPDQYQTWLKVTCKLVKSLTFKQHCKNYSPAAGEVLNSVILDNNLPVVKARKRIFKELKSILQQQIKKSWFGNEKSMAAVRSVVMIVMQLLKDTPKSPYSSTNPTEIAKSLISDPFNMVKLLADVARGVKINANKAGAMLNLILSPLDLLTKYNMSFTLHSGKPEQEPDDEPGEDLGKFEIFDAEEPFGNDDNQSSSSSSRLSMEVDNDLDEDSDSIQQADLDQRALEEEEDDEDLLEESDQIEENLENIQVQDRNTETFWADEGEDDQDPALSVLNLRQNDEFSPEQDLIDREFALDHEDIWDRFERNEDEPPLLNFHTEIEHSEQELMQMVIRRNRIHLELPERPRVRVEENIEAVEQVFNELKALVAGNMDVEETPSGKKVSAGKEEEDKIEERFAGGHKEFERPNEVWNCVEEPELDEDFLLAMPDDLREEILRTHNRVDPNLPRLQAGLVPEIDNSSFIASLTPDLRREILMTANQDILSSLTPELAAEARLLQERVIVRRQGNPERARPIEEGKVLNEMLADDKLSATLASVEDGLLEVLIKGIYLLNPINRDIFSSLLLNLSVQSSVRGKLLDALLCLLEQHTAGKDFPPQKLYGSDTYLENYSQVYAIVAGRILDLLLHLSEHNSKVSQDLVGISKHRLSLIRGLRENEDIRGLSVLLKLTQHKLYETSSSHLTPLVDLLACIVEKIPNDIPILEDSEVQLVCNLLRYESLSDSSVKRVVQLISVLSKNYKNNSQIVKLLYKSFTLLGKEIAQNLRKLETSKDGSKELQLLRIYKVFRAIANDHASLDYLWPPLTEALNSITQREPDFASSANPTLSKLLPIIETFFISHVGQSSTEYFQKFCDKHRKVLNILIKQNPGILQDTFKTLVTEFPALLDFENKRSYFRAEIRKMRPERSIDTIRLQVRRPEVFEDSFHQLKVRTPGEMLGKLRVSFVDEDGVDAGGLTREWYGLLAREMFNPNYALFIPSANGVSFQPNCMSSINAEHLEYFKFIGRIIGKALCDGYALDVYFTRSFYKHILGQEVDYHDMEDLDPDFFKSLKMLMDINLNESDIHEYYFAVEEEEFGTKLIKELEPGGMHKRVTEENKMEYIKLLCHMKMTQNISSQIGSFLEGFHELVPKTMIGIFDSKELELLVSGLPEIDIEDLKSNTEYHNYTKDSNVIVWLWEVLYEFSHEERAEFMQFVTGSSKVPLEGFKALPGMNGVQKFQIHKSFTGPDRLPTAHTCMNQIDLPEYPTKEILRDRIKIAITEGKEGFGFM